MCKPFRAGFHYFFGISLFSPEWHVAEKVFHKLCMGIFDEGFFYFGYAFSVWGHPSFPNHTGMRACLNKPKKLMLG